MAWLCSNPPKELLGKSSQAIASGVAAGNAALLKGKTEIEAVDLAVASAVLVEAVQSRLLEPSKTTLKAAEQQKPSYLQQIINKAAPEPSNTLDVRLPIHQAYLGKSALTTDSNRILVSAEFNSNQQLVLVFNTGERITTKPVISTSEIEQHFTALVPSIYPFIRFDTQLDDPLHDEGMLFYDKLDHSLAYYNDDSDVKVNIGREQLVRVYNNTNVVLLNAQLVYVNGANTSWPTVALAQANSGIAANSTLGMVTADIQPNGYGYVCTSGVVNSVDTSTFASGDTLYLSATTAGGFTNLAPLQPNYNVEIGTVIFSNSITGRIFIHVDKKDWFPSLELVSPETSITLPTTPLVFKPSMVAYNDGFIYDSNTGELTVNTSGTYSLSLQINASPSSANKLMYFYIEERNGLGTWEIKRYSARKYELVNGQESEMQITESRYYKAGVSLRFRLWGEPTVTLKSTDLPGTIAGTATLPALRFMMA